MYNRHALVRRFRENVDREPGGPGEGGHGALLDAARDLLEGVRAAQRLDVLFDELVRAGPRRSMGRRARAFGSHRSARPGPRLLLGDDRRPDWIGRATVTAVARDLAMPVEVVFVD